eukprot:scaffold28845_cov36-Cyclotella_meneghiniana.AAC.1
MEIGQPAELIPIGTLKRSDSLVLSLDVIDFGANLNSTAIRCSLVGVLISLERAGGYHTGVIDTKDCRRHGFCLGLSLVKLDDCVSTSASRNVFLALNMGISRV